MLYPHGGAYDEDKVIADLYRKTHGHFEPGEQKKRDYNWTVDPRDHAFGYSEKKVLDGAAQAMKYERLEESYPKTQIIKKTVEDFRQVNGDPLGKSKNLG